MARYQVRFFKDVAGNGAMRGSFEVEAPTEVMATISGKRRFALQEGIADWSVNANRFEVHPLAGRDLGLARFATA